MQFGVLALVDVLGFKGMWQRGYEGANVLQALDRARSIASRLAADKNRLKGGDMWERLSIEIRTFSDTLVILASLPPMTKKMQESYDDGDINLRIFYDAARKYMLLRCIVILLSKIITDAASCKPPLLYRGCIAFGAFESNDFAFLGPAVDEAGSFFEAAEGAFVFLTPSAAEVFKNRPGLLARANFPYFVTYDVPLKGGVVLTTFTLNPLLFRTNRTADELVSEITSYFGSESQAGELESKRTNTKRFLNFIKDHWLPAEAW